MNLVSTFLERKSDWITGLYEHLQISLLSLIIAIFIAVPLGVIISGNKKTSEWFLQITGIFQTIPSLALLGLFIPFMGIGTLPAVVALVIYAIFPILQSTITGLSEIDPSLEEAATAFGMTKLEKLKKFKTCTRYANTYEWCENGEYYDNWYSNSCCFNRSRRIRFIYFIRNR